MAEISPTCDYVLDPEDPSTWEGNTEICHVDDRDLGSDGLWECPHDVESAGQQCLYHRPVEEKVDSNVLDQLRQDIAGGETGRSTFHCAGARFGRFELVSDLTAGRLALPHASVTDSLDWSGATLTVPYLSLAGLTVAGPADFSDCTFTGFTSFAGVQFEDEVLFEGAEFQGPFDLRFGSVSHGGSWREVQFDDGCRFTGTEFGADTTFQGAQFGDDAVFNRVTVRGDLSFEESTFDADASFASLQVYGEANFDGATLGTDPDFSFAEFGDVDRSGLL